MLPKNTKKEYKFIKAPQRFNFYEITILAKYYFNYPRPGLTLKELDWITLILTEYNINNDEIARYKTNQKNQNE